MLKMNSLTQAGILSTPDQIPWAPLCGNYICKYSKGFQIVATVNSLRAQQIKSTKMFMVLKAIN